MSKNYFPSVGDFITYKVTPRGRRFYAKVVYVNPVPVETVTSIHVHLFRPDLHMVDNPRNHYLRFEYLIDAKLTDKRPWSMTA